MARVLAIAGTEFRIALRNRWVLTATLIMVLFALALTFAGSAPTGVLGVDMLTIAVASMTTLSVYLAPLLALMISFDGIAGEAERGGLALILSYPVSRAEILLGKFSAHLAALAIAMALGFGAAGLVTAALGGASAESLIALLRLLLTSILLGAAFLALGYALSSLSSSSTAAAGLSAGAWLILVVLFDLGLLGAVVLDDGGVFTQRVFPWLMTANPADAFRLWNIADETVALASGLSGAASALPAWAAPLSLLVWPPLGFLFARWCFGRVEP
ncbi:ABC transporter permease [Pikeienuella sp. HZG-20]|uniref:ABC transporter permease n=1 Tax=Paludibacillus litoralis TaxID=3133267 RepID=UPI0030EE33BA